MGKGHLCHNHPQYTNIPIISHNHLQHSSAIYSIVVSQPKKKRPIQRRLDVSPHRSRCKSSQNPTFPAKVLVEGWNAEDAMEISEPAFSNLLATRTWQVEAVLACFKHENWH
jgi:hypothetical protein